MKKLAGMKRVDLSACHNAEERARALVATLGEREKDHGDNQDEPCTDTTMEDVEAQALADREQTPSAVPATDTPDPDSALDTLFGSDWRSTVPRPADLMETYTTAELQVELRKLYPKIKVTGDKSKLADLMSRTIKGRLSSAKFARTCLTCNSEVGKALTTQFHGENFNGVDVFDLLMSFLKPDDRTVSQHWHLVGWMARLALVHGHSLHSTLSWTHSGNVWYKGDKSEYERQKGAMATAHADYIAARLEHARQRLQ